VVQLRDTGLGDHGVVCQGVLQSTTKQRIVLGRGGGKQNGWEMEILVSAQVFHRNIVDRAEAQLFLDRDQGVPHIALDVEAVERRQPPPPVSHVLLVEDDR
jgi:hypothetical protein